VTPRLETKSHIFHLDNFERGYIDKGHFMDDFIDLIISVMIFTKVFEL